jgi:hypothetical protein
MLMRSLLLPALLAIAVCPPARAQTTPTVSATVTGYTAIENRAVVDADQVPIAVSRSDGPNHAEASGEGGRLISYPSLDPLSFGFTSASSLGFASADPGVLHVYGGVRAVATDVARADGAPSLTSSFNVSTNVNVSASFTDYLTVSHADLAAGTLVQVPFRYLAEVVSNYPLGYPQYSAHPVSVYASFDIPGIGPQNFSTESGYFPWTRTTLANGNGLYVVRSDPFTIEARVGDVLPVSALFAVSGQANITDFNRRTDYGAFADGRNTAALWLGDLPDGMTITSASGHDYRIDPTAIATAPVPEPESYALMLAGLGALGFLARRKSAAKASSTRPPAGPACFRLPATSNG